MKLKMLTTGTTVFLKASESLYFLVFFTVYISCLDNIRFENPIPNDISAYNILKYKSDHSDNFIITYKELQKIIEFIVLM